MQAIIVIDMLGDFIESQGKLYIGQAGDTIIKPIAALVSRERARKPVIYVCDSHLATDKEFEMFPAHCLKGTEGAEIIPQLQPAQGDIIIEKRRYCAFFGTDLDVTLREKGVEEIVLAGVCTNICVLYTAASARMLGYKVTVYRDCVASFDEEAHHFAVQEMEKTLGVKIANFLYEELP